jgi:hypothetical protein
VCREYSRAGIWEYYTWDENATSATKLYVTVASCGYSGQTGEKKKKKKKEGKKKIYGGVTEGSGIVTWS